MNKITRIYNKLLYKFGKQNWWPVTSNNPEFEIIIGAILTQNTSWKNVEKAIENLKKEELIDIKKINKINKNKLSRLIKSAGYFNQKAERLKIFMDYVDKNYKNNLKKFLKKDIKNMRKELLSIKGIGNETADSIILYAAEKPIFVIDAYTKRIFTRVGLIDENIGYEELQELFHDNLKKDYRIFNEYHALLVELGKNICVKKPKCEICPINKECKKIM